MKHLIKQSIFQLTLPSLLVISCLLAPMHGFANEAAVKVRSLINPMHSNAIQIGDVLERTIEVEVSADYQLPKTSLPIKGENRNGIELRDIAVQTTKSGERVIYTLFLSSQVLASAAKPVVLQLPEEHFSLTGGAKALSIDVPVWRFWYSPLVPEGLGNAKAHMQPQVKPSSLALKPYYTGLWASLGLLAIGLLGLVYVNADKSWLPWMNGAFAQAHRQIKKLGNEPASDRHALMHMHQAFNKLYGENLFANELDKFFAAHPKFIKMQAEIVQFFAQSNAALFGQHANSGNQLQHLKVLSKRFRDCERGV